jgi:2,4-dienoyl-CoA reductase (NADPH2)
MVIDWMQDKTRFADAPQPVAASYIPQKESPRPQFVAARALTVREIEEIRDAFVQAAVRIKKAGFEGIELNGATNHLLNSFLSRAWNRREDEYGSASFQNRTRLVVDIIREIKRLNGKDFAVIALINGVEVGLKQGITIKESAEIAGILERAGADAIEVRVEYYSWTDDDSLRESTHFPDIYAYPAPPERPDEHVDLSRFGAGANVPVAAQIKKNVSVPVITVGWLDAELGEKAIGRGAIDFISLNRRLLADPELPNKIASGRVNDIAPCTACISCFNFGEHGIPISCRVNAALGREREYEIKPAERKKRVMIVGGGPAGMEAARVAALRGHDVELYERERRLGGSLPLAAIVKGLEREDLISLVRYLERQTAKLGVKVRLGVEADRSMVEKYKPDALIVAAGGVHQVLHLPGADGHNVVTGRDLHKKLRAYLAFFGPKLLRWLTNFYLPLGKEIVIVGGALHGCQVAEFLIKRGRKVTIVESAEQIGEGLPDILIKPYLLNWLREKGATLIAGVRYERITEKGIVVTTREGKRQALEADTVLVATPLLPNAELEKSLEGSAPEVYFIGDSKAPNMIIDAIADGSRIGRLV